MIEAQKFELYLKVKNSFKKNWELIVNITIFFIIIVPLLIYSYFVNDNHIIYALDDAYIHMAIAKNFSKHGTWGITEKEFSSSSSSILYTLLLSFFFLFGVNEFVPLILNLVFSVVLLFLIHYILKIKNNLPSYAVIACSILMILFIPLPFLIFTGMEHVIQICIDLLFVYLASNLLSEKKIEKGVIFKFKKEGKLHFSKFHALILIAPLITMVRFEGMFLLLVVSMLFIIRKRIIDSLLITLFGFLPIIIFGIISINQGWYFFPNSVILKGNEPNLTSLEGILAFFDLSLLIKAPHISILLLGSILIIFNQYYKKRNYWCEKSVMASIFILVTILHFLFIGAIQEHQNLSRYDGYLVALGLITFFITIKSNIPQNISLYQLRIYFSKLKDNYKKNIIQIVSITFIIVFIFYSFSPRSYNLIRKSPQASNNIYEQPFHVALFLKEYYDGECIVANDIGAMNYYADIECLDLRGLGSIEVANAQLDGEFGTRFVEKEAEKRDCKIAVIFEHKDYGYGIPDEWIKAGEWKVQDNVVLGDETISFWAIPRDEFDNLISHLIDFSDRLPSTVIESGNYTDYF